MSVLSSRTQRILEAPVLPLLLSLAAPNIGEAAARITFLTADALFVSCWAATHWPASPSSFRCS